MNDDLACMALALGEHVILAPFQILRPETDDATTGLPVQHLVTHLLIHFVR